MKNSRTLMMPFTVWIWACLFATTVLSAELRPPSVPLIACDPYFSVWSSADRLTDADTVHWTGKPHRLGSLVRIDGSDYRLMGTEPERAPAMTQASLQVLPTRTIYTFHAAGLELTVTFLTPALPDDLDILSRPVTYITYEARSTDGKAHDVSVLFSASGELAVNTPDQLVDVKQEENPHLIVFKIGSTDQAVLGKAGDDLRIDWGYLYVAAPRTGLGAPTGVAAKSGAPPQPAGTVTAHISFDLKGVTDEPVSRWLMLAYDDLYSIQYMKKNLRPYWRRKGWEAADLLTASAADYQHLSERCAAFDDELMSDLTRAGGANYAALCALAYRQCFAAGKFVADDNGQPLQFCKENHSNGCIGTSDVFYPMSPQFLLLGPTLAKSFLVPFMNYAASDRWKFPFAPHDLGTYPHANGQRYGGGERSEENQMPVEESGNLLLLMAAIAQMEGHADFAGLYWKQLEQWAEFLKDKGFDPENQLCTDDFAGHLAHNVNLSAKAICGLGAFAKLCALRGDQVRAAEYRQLARQFATRWVEEADDGDHFQLAFDRPGTWSQKYNLVWDRILGLDLFPDEVVRREMDYYKKIQNPYGLPLDSRQTYTKLDWVLWTATLTQDRADFEALVDPVVKFLNETPDRVPMTDWYFTDNARRRGFTARPVVGGVFLRMLYDTEVWNKYARRDKTKAASWAPMPTPPRTVTLVPTSEREPATWRFTLTQPAGEWQAPAYDDGGWQEGTAGFGTEGTPGTVVRTDWNTSDIWLRRTFDLAEPLPDRVALRVHHDEDAEIFLNGQRVLRRRGYTTDYETEEISPKPLKTGSNVIAIHCHQTSGGQYIDAGLDAIVPVDTATNTSPRTSQTSRDAQYDAYLMAYFGPEEKLYYALSDDARHWQALNGGRPVFDAGVRLRDPFVNRARGKFHLVHTKGWDYPTIFHWESEDLVHWKGGPIEVVDAALKRAWAPEFFFDPEEDLFYVFWASVQHDHNTLYVVTTRDWTDITPSRSSIFYDIGIHDIDLTIVEHNGVYYGFHKPGDVDDVMGNRLSTSKTLSAEHNSFASDGPGKIVFEGQTKPTEGPEVIKLIGEDRWYIYGDPFRAPLEAWETRDFASFRKIETTTPDGAKHCSMIPITAAQRAVLLAQYPTQ